jgi:AraC-like DNA-binding protein
MRQRHDRDSESLALASRAKPEITRPGGTNAVPVGSEGIDTLSDVLHAVKLSSALFFLVDAAAPWSADVPDGAALAPVILPGAQHIVSYHLITRGGCWCAIPGEPSTRLETGDVIVIPHGDAYGLSTDRSRLPASDAEPGLEFFRMLASGTLPRLLSEGGNADGERLQLACGFLACDALPFNPVLVTLPRRIHLRASVATTGDRLSRLLEFALAESKTGSPGSECVLLRISELMFVEVIRRYIAMLPADQRGWLAGLRDPVVGRALALLHRDPSSPWSLEQLARQIGTSRSALASRFTQFVGQPPMHYLARWRMQLAARLLADRNSKIAAVALKVGYDSEAAFSRAFKRAAGLSPAAWRSQVALRDTQSRRV